VTGQVAKALAKEEEGDGEEEMREKEGEKGRWIRRGRSGGKTR